MNLELVKTAVFFSFGSSVAFITGCTLIWPWWRSAAGRGMVSLSAALVVILLPAVVHYTTGLNLSNDAYSWYYFGSLVLAGMIELYRLAAVYRIQKQETPGSTRGKE